MTKLGQIADRLDALTRRFDSIRHDGWKPKGNPFLGGGSIRPPVEKDRPHNSDVLKTRVKPAMIWLPTEEVWVGRRGEPHHAIKTPKLPEAVPRNAGTQMARAFHDPTTGITYTNLPFDATELKTRGRVGPNKWWETSIDQIADRLDALTRRFDAIGKLSK